MTNLNEEIKKMKYDFDLIQKAYCTKEEEDLLRKMEKEDKKLPENVEKDDFGYFRYVDIDLPEEKLSQLLLYRQLSYLRSIKNSMTFFVVLTILVLIILFLASILN
jgi:hypothetical protein